MRIEDEATLPHKRVDEIPPGTVFNGSLHPGNINGGTFMKLANSSTGVVNLVNGALYQVSGVTHYMAREATLVLK